MAAETAHGLSPGTKCLSIVTTRSGCGQAMSNSRPNACFGPPAACSCTADAPPITRPLRLHHLLLAGS